MLGFASSLRMTNRERVNVLAITAVLAALLGLAVLAPSSAHAAGCDSWTNTAGGNYFTGTNWSNDAPPGPSEEGCITAAGTYTVTMTQTSGTVSVGSLTVGGESGTQTLVVGSSCSVNAILATTGGISTGAHGAITLTNGDGCANSVTVEGPITNAGTLSSEPAKGGSRRIQGSLTNTGTLVVDTGTSYNGASATLTNEGAIDLAEGEQLSVSNGGVVANETGGSIVAVGNGDVAMGSGTIFNEGAGTTGGTLPVIVDDGALNYTGSGASTIALRGSSSSTLSGASGISQTLSIQSTCSENAAVSAASGFTNGGTLLLTNGDSCKNNDTLMVGEGKTLTNSGKLLAEPDVGGSRTIQGNITNTGTIAINQTTAYSGTNAILNNNGAIDVANETALNVSGGGTVNNSGGGSIAGTGNGDVEMGSGTTFNQGTGTTSGTLPVIVDDGALNYTGNGASTIALRGSSSTTLSGTSVSGQSTTIQSTCSENAAVSAASGFTNGGTLLLTNGDSCKNNDTLVVGEGKTLINSGKLLVEPGVGGSRTIQGSVTNTGTIAINQTTAYNEKGAVLTNEGAIDIANETALNVSGGGTVTNGKGSSIAATGNGDVAMGP
ncbi:MAG TPA: hypothetical protein VIJ33_01630, partial [Solirubrobacteraceae bacterium]